MYTLMTKLIAGIITLLGITLLFCENPADSDSNSNGPDGLTSATGKYFHLDSLRLTSTSATCYWRDHWDDGDEQKLKWGTDKNYTLGSIDLMPVTPDVSTKTIIPNLTPGTHYYAQFYRPYDGSNSGNVSFDFTTPVQ